MEIFQKKLEDGQVVVKSQVLSDESILRYNPDKSLYEIRGITKIEYIIECRGKHSDYYLTCLLRKCVNKIKKNKWLPRIR